MHPAVQPSRAAARTTREHHGDSVRRPLRVAARQGRPGGGRLPRGRERLRRGGDGRPGAAARQDVRARSGRAPRRPTSRCRWRADRGGTTRAPYEGEQYCRARAGPAQRRSRPPEPEAAGPIDGGAGAARRQRLGPRATSSSRSARSPSAPTTAGSPTGSTSWATSASTCGSRTSPPARCSTTRSRHRLRRACSPRRPWLFYTRVDEAWRPHQVWRHAVGAPGRGRRAGPQRGRRAVLARRRHLARRPMDACSASGPSTTSEVRMLAAADPDGRVPRRRAPSRGRRVRRRAGRATGCSSSTTRDARTSTSPGRRSTPPSDGQWQPIVARAPGERFRRGRRLRRLRRALAAQRRAHRPAVLPRDRRPDGVSVRRTISLRRAASTRSASGDNPESDSSTHPARLRVARHAAPYGLRPRRGDRRAHPAQAAAGPSAATTPRHTSSGASGPRRATGPGCRSRWSAGVDTTPDGAHPWLLTAYGAYEISIDPYFSVARLSLLERGFVYAVAHVRGGGEMGRRGTKTGKLRAKAQHLHRLRRLCRPARRARLVGARPPCGRRGFGRWSADRRGHQPGAASGSGWCIARCRSSTR